MKTGHRYNRRREPATQVVVRLLEGGVIWFTADGAKKTPVPPPPRSHQGKRLEAWQQSVPLEGSINGSLATEGPFIF